MTLLFCHDHRFAVDSDGVVYSDGKLPYKAWTRYLNHCDELVVIARHYPVSAIHAKNLDVSSGTNVTFVFCPNISSIKGLIHRRKAKRLIASVLDRVDAVIARVPSEISALVVSESERLRIPWSVEVVACAWDGLWNYGDWKGRLYAPFAWLKTKHVVKKARWSLYVTSHFLQRRYPNRKGHVISCSNVELSPPQESVYLRRKERIDQDKRLVTLGLIGSLRTRSKGHHVVFEALKLVRKRMPDIEFHCLGSGDSALLKSEAKEMGVQDLVFFNGVLPAGDPVLEWLDEVDIYVQPSFQEGLPRALIEAMSRGCPALASRCAGIPELLDDDCLFKPGDAAHLSELLVQMITDKTWQHDQAHKNTIKAENFYADVLEDRRNEFLGEFVNYVRSKSI